ncbi:unnamed protein product [Microthlaspi erraticum]|uniref:Uncharacterized protein n=1 Tax=Microthlaspi erraticum TaxID=1685480 RepID=A0A6D2K9U7_9BRAS|nr:unnamed protein product [Microthlaspi erraticum]
MLGVKKKVALEASSTTCATNWSSSPTGPAKTQLDRAAILGVKFSLASRTKLRKFGRVRRSSRRPKVTILIWKDRYLSHASRRSGMKPFGSTIRPKLIFYRDMSGKRANEAHGGFGVSNGPSSSAKGLDRKRRGLANVWSFPWYNVGPYTTWREGSAHGKLSFSA